MRPENVPSAGLTWCGGGAVPSTRGSGSSPPSLPPPRLSHSILARVGKLPATHIKNINTTPIVNGKLIWLCTYLAAHAAQSWMELLRQLIGGAPSLSCSTHRVASDDLSMLIALLV